MIVLTGTGLLLRALDDLRRIDPGFDTRNLILFAIHPELAGDGQFEENLPSWPIS